MARAWIADEWLDANRQPTARNGTGSRWRVYWWEDSGPERRRRSKRFTRKPDAQQYAAARERPASRGAPAAGTRRNQAGRRRRGMAQHPAGYQASHLPPLRTEPERLRPAAMGSAKNRHDHEAGGSGLDQRTCGRHRVRSLQGPEKQPAQVRVRPHAWPAQALEHRPHSHGPVRRPRLGSRNRPGSAVTPQPVPACRESPPRNRSTSATARWRTSPRPRRSSPDAPRRSPRPFPRVHRPPDQRGPSPQSLRPRPHASPRLRRYNVDAGQGRQEGTGDAQDPRETSRTVGPFPRRRSSEAHRRPGAKCLRIPHPHRRGSERPQLAEPRLQPRRTRRRPPRLGSDAAQATPHGRKRRIGAGADVKVVQLMLGHKDATETLNTYGHLWPDRLDEVSAALEAARTSALATSGNVSKCTPRTA